MEGGLRVDSHSEYGSFVLPRASLLFLPMDDLTLRLGGGFDYKTPSVFVSDAEEIQFQNLEAIDPTLFDGEASRGINFDINHRLDTFEDFSLTSNILFFYTEIEDSVRIIEEGDTAYFSQLDDPVDTQGVELNLIFAFHTLRYFFGYTYVDAVQRTDFGEVELPLISRHRVNQVLVWEKEDDYRIGIEAYYFSSQHLENDSRGEGYWIFGLMSEKKFNESLTVFLNFENLTDSRQTEHENINLGDLQNPDFRDEYAPLDEFVINGGV